MTNTIKLEMPQWQGGENPNYFWGSKILAAIVPDIKGETFKIGVKENFTVTGNDRGAVFQEDALVAQFVETKQILALKQPKRVITLGGDCATSHAPFDYLSGRYQDDLGVIWLDAHPDISSSKESKHAHEMVVTNLLGLDNTKLAKQTAHPLQPQQVLYAGLKAQDLRPMDQAVKRLQIAFLTPEKLRQDNAAVTKWLKQHHFSKVAVHFDLDVLTPADYRSILPANPHADISQFGAAVGSMTLSEVGQFFEELTQASELVGLTIAEHMPWDAMNLHAMLRNLAIFN